MIFMVHTVNALIDTLNDKWNLKGVLIESNMKWRPGKANTERRFAEKLWSLEFVTMTAPHRKRTRGKALVNRILTVDIWYRPKSFTEDNMQEHNDDIREVINEICRIVEDQQDDVSGTLFTHVMNQEINLDEPDNGILRRQMNIACKEVEQTT